MLRFQNEVQLFSPICVSSRNRHLFRMRLPYPCMHVRISPMRTSGTAILRHRKSLGYVYYLYLIRLSNQMPVTVAVKGAGLHLPYHRIMSSNTAQGVEIYLFVLCCPVYIEALRRSDYSSKEPYQMSKSIIDVRRSRSFKECRAKELVS